ncbi:MAG: dihydropteroate synthase [Rhizobacter sp.]|nr:dihydropteroate synthase [Rhizobacter sp.]
MNWQTTRHQIDLSRVRVMGIVNVTPDSFSDGGQIADPAAAIAQCERLLAEGADMLDIGGESSRPGAVPVSIQLELHRVIPVLQGALKLGCPVSIDTTKPEVMQVALDMGVDIVNDINALRAPGAVDAVASHGCGLCLMHMRGEPGTMQSNPSYDDVVAEVTAILHGRMQALRAKGIAESRVVLDPGIGFGKSVDHNIELLRRQRELLSLGRPLLVGWSRKSTLGAITGRDLSGRLAASLAAALAAIQNGASIIRVHDVAASSDALRVWRAAGLCQ